jgi:hypothetical protein
MEKKTIIKISIISIIISMIYLLLQYFGIIRYVKLYFSSLQNYIENYKNLDKIDKNNKVVINLTLNSKNVKKLTPVINSLLDQTTKVDLISVTIPDGKDYKLPEKIKDAVFIVKSNENYGELTPLLSSVLDEGENNTKIIILGDDKIYGKDFIEKLIVESNENPDKIIYANSKNSINLNQGVIFKSDFFDEKFLDIKKNVNPHKWVNNYFKDYKKKKISYYENYKI